MAFLQRLKPPGYVTSSLIISTCGFFNGFDTGSIGAVTVMPSFEATFGALSPFTRGFTVSVVMLAGAVPAMCAGQFSDRYGHLPILGAGALVLGTGALVECVAPMLGLFIAGRVVAGVGQGILISLASVYICEIAPSARRGMLVATPTFMTVLGICLGYFTCYGTVHIQSSMSWRIPFVIQTVAAAMLAISCKFLPNSPRWLVLHGRRDEAMLEIERLGIMRAEAEKDILRASDATQDSKAFALGGILLIFRKPYRGRTILGLFVLGMIQLSGIDGILYYAPLLFREAGLPVQTSGFLASGVSAILMLVFSIPATIFADRWGRRTAVISGGLILSFCMFTIGSLYASGSVSSHGIARWFVIVLIFVFALTYTVTFAVSGRIFAAEIQPAKTRASANCVAQGLGFFTNWLVAFATPIFLARSSYGPYFLFGALALGTVTVLALYMPETRGEPLESIEEAFRRPVLQSWMVRLQRLATMSFKSPIPGTSTLAAGGTEVNSSADGSRDTSIEMSDFPVRPVVSV